MFNKVKKRIKNNRGTLVIAAMIAVLVMALLGTGMAYFIASNQQQRLEQVTGDQAFYSVQAGLEYALGKIINESSPDTSFSISFAGETVTIVRNLGRVDVSSAKINAESDHSIVDPNPPGPTDCLLVDTSAAYIQNQRLRGVDLRRDPSCTEPLTITSMSGTAWQPVDWRELYEIRIENVSNWVSGNSGDNFPFATPYTIDDGNIHDLTRMTWSGNMTDYDFQLIFNYTYDGNNYSKLVNVDFLADNQASCLACDTSNAKLNWTWSEWLRLVDTSITNSCSKNIRLNKMTMSWVPVSPARTINEVQIGGASAWPSAASGVEFDYDNVINASSTEDVNRFTFSSEMLGRNYTVLWTFTDGTSKSTTLDLFAPNQSLCLNIDTSGVAIGSNASKIEGLKIQNTCALDIGMTSVSLSWSGDTSRRFQRARIQDHGGNNTYWGNSASGVPIDFSNNDLYLRNEDGAKDIEYLQFNNAITTGMSFTLTFTMSDGTQKSATFIFGSQAQSLVVNTSGAYIGSLKGIVIANDSKEKILWDLVVMHWDPTYPTRVMTEIVVSKKKVWKGKSEVGEKVDIKDVVIDPGEKMSIDWFDFDSSMCGKTFYIEFIMGDGSIKTTEKFEPKC